MDIDSIKTDMNSMLNSMSSWWGGGSETPQQPPQSTEETKPEAEVHSGDKPADTQATTQAEPSDKPTTPTEKGSNEQPEKEKKDEAAGGNADSAPDDKEKKSPIPLDIDLEEMSTKAVSAAKEWGSYLFTVGKTATHQVTEQVKGTAKQLKDTIDEKTMIGDFNKEQTKFVSENQDKKKKTEASVPPWVGYNEEDAMKTQILALSLDKRNFLRNPPAGVQFNFEFDASFPVATAMLQEDPNLKKMRFELVPKQVKENIFWRNYFYRVSLIKQSAQLTSLAQQSGEKSPSRASPARPDSGKKESESVKETKAKSEGKSSSKEDEKDLEDFPPSSPPEHDFVSDAFQESGISEEDFKKEMQQLGMTDQEEDIPEWEKELQAELQEYEVVDDGNDLDDADLEQEIMEQLEAESNGEEAKQ